MLAESAPTFDAQLRQAMEFPTLLRESDHLQLLVRRIAAPAVGLMLGGPLLVIASVRLVPVALLCAVFSVGWFAMALGTAQSRRLRELSQQGRIAEWEAVPDHPAPAVYWFSIASVAAASRCWKKLALACAAPPMIAHGCAQIVLDLPASMLAAGVALSLLPLAGIFIVPRLAAACFVASLDVESLREARLLAWNLTCPTTTFRRAAWSEASILNRPSSWLLTGLLLGLAVRSALFSAFIAAAAGLICMPVLACLGIRHFMGPLPPLTAAEILICLVFAAFTSPTASRFAELFGQAFDELWDSRRSEPDG